MSKAEEKTTELMKKAKDFIPDGGYSEKELNLAFFMFIKGYHQAEKDLELSWEDIPKIFQISEELKTSWWFRDNEQTKLIGTQVFWEEVLKRFKNYKERKENGE